MRGKTVHICKELNVLSNRNDDKTFIQALLVDLVDLRGQAIPAQMKDMVFGEYSDNDASYIY